MRLRTFIRKLQSSERHHKKLYFLLMVGLGIFLFLPVFFQIQFQSLKSFGLIGVFFINILGSATIFLPTPAILSVGISATQSNPLLVAAIASLGAALGEGTTFLFGYTSNKFFELEKHAWLKGFKERIFDRWGSAVILFFAFTPNPLFDGVGMIAGVSKYPIKKFILLTFVGRFLRYLVIGYVALYFVTNGK